MIIYHYETKLSHVRISIISPRFVGKQCLSMVASDVVLLEAEKFTSNGTHIGITLADGEEQAEMIQRLTHNGTHLIIAQYALHTQRLNIDPGIYYRCFTA